MKCEFCEKEYLEDELEGTSVVGCYCVPCHKLAIAESREAIKLIKARKKPHNHQINTDMAAKSSNSKSEFLKSLDSLINYKP